MNKLCAKAYVAYCNRVIDHYSRLAAKYNSKIDECDKAIAKAENKLKELEKYL